MLYAEYTDVPYNICFVYQYFRVNLYLGGESISLPEPETDCLGLFDEWEEYKDTFTSKAKFYAKVRGKEACKKACVEEIVGCVAVEYHISNNCWYHDRDIDFGKNLKRRKEYVLYVRIGGCKNTKSVQDPLLNIELDLFG